MKLSMKSNTLAAVLLFASSAGYTEAWSSHPNVLRSPFQTSATTKNGALWMASPLEDSDAESPKKNPLIMPPSNATEAEASAATARTTPTIVPKTQDFMMKNTSEDFSSSMEAQLEDLTTFEKMETLPKKKEPTLKQKEDEQDDDDDGELHFSATPIEAPKGFGASSSSSSSFSKKKKKQQAQKIKSDMPSTIMEQANNKPTENKQDSNVVSTNDKLSSKDSEQVKSQIRNAMNKLQKQKRVAEPSVVVNAEKGIKQDLPDVKSLKMTGDVIQKPAGGPVEIAKAEAKKIEQQQQQQSVEKRESKMDTKMNKPPIITSATVATQPTTDAKAFSPPPKVEKKDVEPNKPPIVINPPATPSSVSSTTKSVTATTTTTKTFTTTTNAKSGSSMQVPKLDKKDYEKALTMASSTAELATTGAKTMFKAVAFVAKESITFAQSASEVFESTTIDDTDMTYKEALSKVSKSTRGFVKLLQVLAQDSATYVSKELASNNTIEPPKLPDFKEAISSVSSTLKKGVAAIPSGDTLLGTFKGLRTAARKTTDSSSSEGIEGNKNQKKTSDLPYFLEYTTSGPSSSNVFSSTLSSGDDI